MQPVNGVDQAHEAATISSPPKNAPRICRSSGGPEVKLKEPLRARPVSPNPQKPGLSANQVIYVVERLNDVFRTERLGI